MLELLHEDEDVIHIRQRHGKPVTIESYEVSAGQGAAINLTQSQLLALREDLENNVLDIEEHRALLSNHQLRRLAAVCKTPTKKQDTVSIDDVVAQFNLVRRLRDRMVDENDTLLDGVEAKDLRALISAITSFITLYLRQQAAIDHLLEIRHLHDAINTVVKDFSPEDRARFYKRLEELKHVQ